MSALSDRQDKKKEKIAKEFEKELTLIFAKYISAYRTSISLSLPRPDSRDVIGDLISEAIRKHTIKAQEAFRNEAFSNFDPSSLDDLLEQSFSRELNQWLLSNEVNKTEIINNTNNYQANDTLGQATDILIQEGQQFSRRDLSILASSLLARKFIVRSRIISETEVQSASESTKFIKTRLASNSPIISSRYLIVKVWNSLLDGRERDTHREADAQERPVDLAFTVGGASLMYPGDPNGPFREIVNCRCFETSITREL